MSSRPAFIRTRIAPTPSGLLHLGNLYSFALTAKLARESGAKMMLRIDDYDHVRSDVRYVEDILECLDQMKIPVDEGPRSTEDFDRHFSAGHRKFLYDRVLEQLRISGRIYACDCSRAEVSAAGDRHPG